MIDPTRCAEKIVLNDPALAEPLLDLLIWANQSRLGDSNDYDEILEFLYSRTPHSRDARAAYISGRAA